MFIYLQNYDFRESVLHIICLFVHNTSLNFSLRKHLIKPKYYKKYYKSREYIFLYGKLYWGRDYSPIPLFILRIYAPLPCMLSDESKKALMLFHIITLRTRRVLLLIQAMSMMLMAPLFSMEYRWIMLMPFWLSADVLFGFFCFCRFFFFFFLGGGGGVDQQYSWSIVIIKCWSQTSGLENK